MIQAIDNINHILNAIRESEKSENKVHGRTILEMYTPFDKYKIAIKTLQKGSGKGRYVGYTLVKSTNTYIPKKDTTEYVQHTYVHINTNITKEALAYELLIFNVIIGDYELSLAKRLGLDNG